MAGKNTSKENISTSVDPTCSVSNSAIVIAAILLFLAISVLLSAAAADAKL
jgi:hypothetical protein